MRKSSEKQVLNLQLKKNGQYVITIHPEWMNQLQQPHPVVCSGNHDATLFNWLPPNSTIGPILSVRAFEFESVCGLDLSIPSPQNDKLAVWITACLDKLLFCKQTGFDGV